MYDYPSGTHVGGISGFGGAAGLCVNPTGDVWVVDSTGSKVVEYAHGSKIPMAQLTVGGMDILGCAVDPVNGNLAVTDLGGPSGGGGVWIFAGGEGTPTFHRVPSISFAYFCAYDPSGDLFIDGLDKKFAFELAEIPAGQSKLETIHLPQSVVFPGGLAWDGKYLAIGDQEYKGTNNSAIYQVSVSGTSGTIEGTSTFVYGCDMLQFWIAGAQSGQQGSQVVAPDACRNKVHFYPYPAGGKPTLAITGLQYPVAAVVSTTGSAARRP
jgi:hypothetical protein